MQARTRKTRRHLALACGLGCALSGCSAGQDDEARVNAGMGALERVAVGPVPGPKPPPDLRPGPYTGDPVATQEGRRLFVRYNCSGCHGGRAGGGMGPSLRDEDWMYGGSDMDVFNSIAQGRAHGMPAWGTRVPSAQIWKLVAYVQSLRTPLEPDAPSQASEPGPRVLQPPGVSPPRGAVPRTAP